MSVQNNEMKDFGRRDSRVHFWIQGIKVFSAILFIIYYSQLDSLQEGFYAKSLITKFFFFESLFYLLLGFLDKEQKWIRELTFVTDIAAFCAYIIINNQANDPVYFWFAGLMFVGSVYVSFYYALSALLAGVILRFANIYVIDHTDDDFFRAIDPKSYFNIYNAEFLIFAFMVLAYFVYDQIIKQKNKDNLKEAFKDLKSLSTFPRYSPNPIMEFYKGHFFPYNEKSIALLEDLTTEKKEELAYIVKTAIEDKEGGEITLNNNDEYYLIAIIVINEKANLYFTDISNLVYAQKELEQKDTHSRAVLDAIPGFVSWVSKDLKYQGVNTNMSEFFNMRKDEFLGKKLGEMSGGSSLQVQKIVKDLFADESKDMIQETLEFDHSDDHFYNLLNVKKYNNGNNAVLVSIDVTENKRNERRVIEERAKAEASSKLANFGEVTAGIAHEIANPLSVIDGASHRIKLRLEKGKCDEEFLLKISDRISSSVERVHKIIRGLKNLARDGENDPYEPVHLQTIFDDVMSIMDRKFEYQNIKLEVDEFPSSAIIECQMVQIAQIFVIILNNAIDAINDLDNKWINIKYSEDQNNIYLNFIDCGGGISRELAEKIFQSFFTTKAVGKGTGIGLDLAKKILRKHNGDINIDHDYKNTKFDIFIPKKHQEH
jgi:signal transduction histidine kinase